MFILILLNLAIFEMLNQFVKMIKRLSTKGTFLITFNILSLVSFISAVYDVGVKGSTLHIW